MNKIIQSALLLSLAGTSFAEQKDTFSQTLSQFAQREVHVTQVNETPMAGVKEVIIQGQNGKEIYYMSDNGEFMMEGKLYDLKNRVDLKVETENSLRKELMADHADSLQSIDFYPDAMKSHITVFTDIDCGYCRKLHEDMSGYNDLGIGVSYVFFPRGGLQSSSYDKAVNVWCAEDKKQAMTAAKSGQSIEPKMCKNPITSQFNLGIQAGVHKVGTPSVVFADGSLMPGYLPPKAMKAQIEQHKE